MHGYLLDSLAKTASYLVELKDPIVKDIMCDFYVAIDSYVSMVRDIPKDLPASEFRTHLVSSHVVVSNFNTGFRT